MPNPTNVIVHTNVNITPPTPLATKNIDRIKQVEKPFLLTGGASINKTYSLELHFFKTAGPSA